jgi:hypothetical protein
LFRSICQNCYEFGFALDLGAAMDFIFEQGYPKSFIYILINFYNNNYINIIFNNGNAKCLKLLLITT